MTFYICEANLCDIFSCKFCCSRKSFKIQREKFRFCVILHNSVDWDRLDLIYIWTVLYTHYSLNMVCLFLVFVKALSSLKKKVYFTSRLLLWGICLNVKSLWRQEAGISHLDVAGRGQPWTIHLGLISTAYVQVKLQYLIISRILCCITYFSVKSCNTVLQREGAFEDTNYMCTYSRSFTFLKWCKVDLCLTACQNHTV